MGHDCPTCEDSFDTEHGLKIHHSRAHGESLVPQVECENCGSMFQRRPENESRFCSKSCMESWKSDKFSGDGNPAWDGGMVSLKCEECSCEFEVKQAKEGDRRFCSEDCRFSGIDMSGEDNPNWRGGKVSVECEVCSENFEVVPARGDEARFCSLDCYGRYEEEVYVGENHPMWQGGRETYYGENWQRRRRQVIERDQSKCVACGLDRKEHLEQYGRDLNVHHITPLRKFDEPENANSLDNLVTLCELCHHKFETMDGEPDPRTTNPDPAISTGISTRHR